VDVFGDLQALIDLEVVIGVGVEKPTSAALRGAMLRFSPAVTRTRREKKRVRRSIVIVTIVIQNL
jgi:hypothetical protein